MIKFFYTFLFVHFSYFCLSQDVTKIQSDSTKNRYAILQVNWNSKKIVINYEDGTKDEFKSNFGESIAFYPPEKRVIVLLERFSFLKRKGYVLIDSFENPPFLCFVFIKKD
ncbi:MAG: hypothetical protein K2U26_01600 [Cyclobacteriaceae bacterium]|nr:hypothetical protein [Cyclobacteriaceae bacterium]